jgi:hypothetical protein
MRLEALSAAIFCVVRSNESLVALTADKSLRDLGFRVWKNSRMTLIGSAT